MIAIDIAFLCPALNRGDLYLFTHRVFGYNRDLQGVREGVYPLFSQSAETLCLPHITLAQGFIKEEEQEAVASALEIALKEQKPIVLTTNGVRKKQLPNGYTGVELDIVKTEELVGIHTKIMEALAPFLQYTCEDAASFYGKIDPITKIWLQNYRSAAFDKFQPHITLGIGEPKTPSGERDSSCFMTPEFVGVSRIVLGQLGNYCTIQKVMKEYVLIF